MTRVKCARCKEKALLNVQQVLAERAMPPKQPRLNEQRDNLDTQWQELIHANFQLPHNDYPEEGHTSYVYTIQLNGKWLVSGSADKTIRVWNLETRRLRGEPLLGHSQSVLCLQFDPSEKEDVIISGSSDRSIIVWRFSTGQPLKTIPAAHEETILDLRFNQRYLFTASKDKSIKIWNRHELTPLDQEYPRFQDSENITIPSYVLDVSSTEPSLIEAGLANGSMHTLESYTLLATLHGHAAAINSLDFHEDLLFSGSGDRTIRVWSISTGQCIRRLTDHGKGIACMQSNGKQVVSGGSDNSIRIHDVHTGAEVAVLRGHVNLVRTLQADFEGVLGLGIDQSDAARKDVQYGNKWNRIVSGSYDESIIIWKQASNGNWLVEHTLKLRDTEASFHNTDLATRARSTDDHEHTDQQQRRSDSRVFKVRFDGKRMVCSSQDSRIYCWEFAVNQGKD